MQRFVVKRLHGDPILNPPKLIVFDLDFTLWDCVGTWCDCLSPPFRVRHGHISDRSGRRVSLYDDIHAILDHCDQRAVSSTTVFENSESKRMRAGVKVDSAIDGSGATACRGDFISVRYDLRLSHGQLAQSVAASVSPVQGRQPHPVRCVRSRARARSERLVTRDSSAF